MERLSRIGLSQDEIESVDGLILEGKLVPDRFDLFPDNNDGNTRLSNALRKEILKHSTPALSGTSNA